MIKCNPIFYLSAIILNMLTRGVSVFFLNVLNEGDEKPVVTYLANILFKNE